MSIEERDVMFKSGETFAAAWLFLPENGALGARVPAVAMAHGPALTLFAPNPRARGARRASDVGPRSDPHSGVSRATRDQADPLAPAGRRFGNFVFGANDGARAFATNAEDECGRRPRRALGPTGYRQTGGTERSALSCPVILVRAESSCARGAPSQRRRSAERPTFRCQQSDPRSGRPARAGWAALRQFRFWGERWSSGVRDER